MWLDFSITVAVGYAVWQNVKSHNIWRASGGSTLPPTHFCSQYAHFLNDLSFIIYSAAFSYYEVALQFCVLLAILIGFQDLKQQLQILNEFTCRCRRNGRKLTNCSSLIIILCFYFIIFTCKTSTKGPFLDKCLLIYPAHSSVLHKPVKHNTTFSNLSRYLQQLCTIGANKMFY